MMKRALSSGLLMLTLTALAEGCGADNHGGEMPAIGYGNISVPMKLDSSSTASLSANLRVALIWELPDFYSDLRGQSHFFHNRLPGGDAPFDAEGSVTIELTREPPTYKPDNVEFADSDVLLAKGQLIVYDDTFQNQSLDLRLPGQEPYVDRIIGFSDGLSVVYAEHAESTDAQAALKKVFGTELHDGFGVYYGREQSSSPNPFPSSPAYAGLAQFAAAGQRYLLELAPAATGGQNPPEVDERMCWQEPVKLETTVVGTYVHGPSDRRPWELDLTFDTPPVEVCAPDGSWFEQWLCPGQTPFFCSPDAYYRKQCTVHVYTRRDSPEPKWPCPCQEGVCP